MTASPALATSGDDAGAALVDRTIELAFTQLRLGRGVTPDQVEEVVRLVDAGALDSAIEAHAPPVELERPKRRFEHQQPFSHEAWKKRHGLDP